MCITIFAKQPDHCLQVKELKVKELKIKEMKVKRFWKQKVLMHLEVNLRSRRIADNSYEEKSAIFFCFLFFCTSFSRLVMYIFLLIEKDCIFYLMSGSIILYILLRKLDMFNKNLF